jgi:hypothetical protein
VQHRRSLLGVPLGATRGEPFAANLRAAALDIGCPEAPLPCPRVPYLLGRHACPCGNAIGHRRAPLGTARAPLGTGRPAARAPAGTNGAPLGTGARLVCLYGPAAMFYRLTGRGITRESRQGHRAGTTGAPVRHRQGPAGAGTGAPAGAPYRDRQGHRTGTVRGTGRHRAGHRKYALFGALFGHRKGRI